MTRDTSAITKIFLILDDDEDRTARMKELFDSRRRGIAIRIFDNAPELLSALPELVEGCALISLDHDLGPVRERAGQRLDPGIGRAITEALAEITPSCPVIVHTSNGPAAEGMLNDLRFAGWRAVRVVPHADLEWVQSAWLPAVQTLVDGAA